MLKAPGLKFSGLYISDRLDRGALNMFKNMFEKSSKIRFLTNIVIIGQTLTL